MSTVSPVKSKQENPKFHGAPPRGLENVPRSTSHAGRFGRLFRQLEPLDPDTNLLLSLANSMLEQPTDVDDKDATSNNQRLSAGFTYLGQFIDHDLTFDPVSKLQRDNDPNALEDFRTPRFDLDNVFGPGRDDAPFLYNGDKFVIGMNESGEDDLPRSPNGRALLGDPRNDENLIVSQLHLAFLKFHNAVVDALPAGPNRFDDARETVLFHYQWLLIHEFLTGVVGTDLVKHILLPDRYAIQTNPDSKEALAWKVDLKFYGFKVFPFMPVEFSAAAYRFGHSMVRFTYALNPETDGAELPIFATSGPDLRGFRPRPPQRKIEWFRFFKFDGADPDKLQSARAIDTLLSAGLGVLPDVVAQNPNSLPARNLLRGKALSLPGGQDVARLMGIPEDLVLGNNKNKLEVGTGYKLPDGTPDPSVPPLAPALKQQLEDAFGTATPLWYYILKEAEVFGKGQHLGPVGGRIVAEVFLGILKADPTSYLNLAPGWEPSKGHFGCKKDGRYTIQDLLEFAGVAG
jgi:hypothetical protein